MKNYNIAKLMRKKGITQVELANILGISAVSFNHKINGKYDFTQSELIKMSDFFDVSIDELVKE